ncbi:hypothetical protein [Novosphingobium sp. CCH12-A3]|uniref:hypothetical protein n=1 Tax=Novosphingobium sp. CCH12-A3 TaxID=1768752 RepID=UPI000A69A392|nr:hypothetical protein [Novosphingobium sp. CCH12-A3]
MRKHAPMWEAELGLDDGENDIDVYLRKSMDDMDESHEASAGLQRPSWPQLLLFLVGVAIFLVVASGIPFRG